jgi:hypothetical protein
MCAYILFRVLALNISKKALSLPSSIFLTSAQNMKRKLAAESKSARPDAKVAQEEDVDHDDLCPICQLLLYKPVRTRCVHTMCEACMAQWADCSITNQMTTVGLDDQATVFLPHEIETRCPMCRTFTNAVLDPAREAALRQSYPSLYEARAVESRADQEDEFGSTVETLTVYIGNEHSDVRAAEGSNNKHSWKFFVRPVSSSPFHTTCPGRWILLEPCWGFLPRQKQVPDMQPGCATIPAIHLLVLTPV